MEMQTETNKIYSFIEEMYREEKVQADALENAKIYTYETMMFITRAYLWRRILNRINGIVGKDKRFKDSPIKSKRFEQKEKDKK